jgi:signal transduction histidine kinase
MTVSNKPLQAAIPALNWSPLTWWQWWITPRATSREAAFYERNTRGLALLLMATLIAASLAFFPSGVLAGYETIMAFFIFFIAIAMTAIAAGYIGIASWMLASIQLLVAFTTLYTSGYWAPNAIGMLIVTPIVTALLVRTNFAKLFFAVTVFMLFAGVAHYQESIGFVSIFDSNYSFSTPSGATTFFLILMIMFVGSGSYFLFEFRSQQNDLHQMVNTLEQRVSERTHALTIAVHEAETARQQAIDASKIKSQFLANMSHELRTPLNAILNFTAFVADGTLGPVNDEQVETLEEAIASGRHLLSLINDILDITKIEAGLMDLFIQDVDMNEVIGAVAAVGKGLVKDKPIVLNVEIAAGLPTTYGDKRRLRQVFLNMLSNAVKFTREGQVTIRAQMVENKLRVEVQDTGIGITPEDQHHVFESFKQAKHDLNEAIGTGLGMSISKYFVESHGGKMWLTSALGAGTTFYVELPVLTEAEANSINMSMTEQMV